MLNKIRMMDENITINVQENKFQNLDTAIVGDNVMNGINLDNGVDEDKSKLTYSYRFKHYRTTSDSIRLLNRNCCDISEENTSLRRGDFARDSANSLLLKSQSYQIENVNSKATAIKKGNSSNHHTCGYQNIIENDLKFGSKKNIKSTTLNNNDDGGNLPNYCSSNHFSNEVVKSSTLSTSLTSVSTAITFPPLNNKRWNKFNIVRGTRSTICGSCKNILIRNSLLTYVILVLVLSALISLAYFTRDYTKKLLYWIETQNYWIIFIVYVLLFIVVSFPIIVGYLVLMVTAGYLLGTGRGLVTVVLGANIGIAIVHMTIRNLRYWLPLQKIIKNDTGRAILRVISGPRAFRVVMFTRLTPIPFGLQNVIFGISAINSHTYHVATFCGLLPAQIINVYLGSTLRSMQEVLSNHDALTGYISFGIEVICGIGLMFWVVRKARKELSETLLSDLNSSAKMDNIQV